MKCPHCASEMEKKNIFEQCMGHDCGFTIWRDANKTFIPNPEKTFRLTVTVPDGWLIVAHRDRFATGPPGLIAGKGWPT